MLKKDIMHPTTAVFNGHVNDADRRARALMAEFCPKHLEEVLAKEVAGNGIMAIFNDPPTDATKMYSTLVFAYVNENRGGRVEERPIRKRERAIQL